MTGRRLTIASCMLGLSALLLGTTSFAKPYYGVNVTTPLVTKEPSPLHGFQLMFNYDPQRFKWRKFNVYLDGGISHFSVNQTPYYSTINIYSIAPVVRYTFNQHGPIHPYFELSVGFSYLNQTRLENRNLGIHFAFQDRVGLGTFIGKSENFTLGLNAVHYSNAHLSEHNSGITVPVMLNIGYRFS